MTLMAREKLLSELSRKVQSADYLVVINGIPKKFQRSYVKVKVDPATKEVKFFNTYKNAGRTFETSSPNLVESVLSEATSNVLFGFSFDKWVRADEQTRKVSHLTVNVVPSLKVVFIETAMYHIFRKSVPPRENLNFVFTPELDDSGRMTALQMIRLQNYFRVNGFESMLELERVGLGKRIRTALPRLYNMDNVFSLAMISNPMFFNPLVEDAMLRSTYKGSKFFTDLVSRSQSYDKLGLTYMLYSTEHIRKALNLSEAVPMNYQIFTKLLCGLVIDADYLPISIPSKDKVALRLTEISDEFDPVISVAEWNKASDYQKSLYRKTNTLETFILENSDFFRDNGVRMVARLNLILQDMALV